VNGFTENLYTQLGITSNYRATANLHNSQITTAPAKRFPDCCAFTSRSLATAFKSGDSSTSRAQILSSQPSAQNSTELTAPTVLVITSRHGQHRKHSSSIVAFVSVAAGTCLPNCCPEMGCATPFVKNLLPYQRALIRNRYPATGLLATISSLTSHHHWSNNVYAEFMTSNFLQIFQSIFMYPSRSI
jgi:hypothetical protein